MPVPNQYGYQHGQVVDRERDRLTDRYVEKGYLEPGPVVDQKADKAMHATDVRGKTGKGKGR